MLQVRDMTLLESQQILGNYSQGQRISEHRIQEACTVWGISKSDLDRFLKQAHACESGRSRLEIPVPMGRLNRFRR